MLLYWFADFFHKLGFVVDFHYMSLILSVRHYIESELSSEGTRVGELGAQLPVLHVNDPKMTVRAALGQVAVKTH